MKAEWLKHCVALSKEGGDFYSGCRKIIRRRTLSFYTMDDSLQMQTIGYTKSKMAGLKRGYLHEESKSVAEALWERRREQDKYGSVGVTTYNHFIKNDPNKKSKRASVMGPCIQSMVITYLDKTTYTVDLFYRTTELFKKFPADLVFVRDVLLPGFKLEGMQMEEMNCHFANITMHPMYAVCTIPHLKDFVAEWDKLKIIDPYFYNWMIKWTARYVCEEHMRGIQKFAQALRVKDFADEQITGKLRKTVTEYLRDNHPGHRNAYVDKDLAGEDE